MLPPIAHETTASSGLSHVDGVISIGATDFEGNIAGFSSRGPTADGRTKPDVVAPGAGVWTVKPGTLGEYTQLNGTSLATPLAAGVAALLLQAYPELDPPAMLALLRSTAVRLSSRSTRKSALPEATGVWAEPKGMSQTRAPERRLSATVREPTPVA